MAVLKGPVEVEGRTEGEPATEVIKWEWEIEGEEEEGEGGSKARGRKGWSSEHHSLKYNGVQNCMHKFIRRAMQKLRETDFQPLPCPPPRPPPVLPASSFFSSFLLPPSSSSLVPRSPPPSSIEQRLIFKFLFFLLSCECREVVY